MKSVRNIFILILLFDLLGACDKVSIAPKPPMGWNSYDCFGYGVNEKQVKENADYMASSLKEYGWEYIVVDFLWSLPDIGPALESRQMYQNDQFVPRLNMDKFGRLLPDTFRFPSASGKLGFIPLAEYIHAKGLKFGIHVMRGIPRQASVERTPILNSNRLASQVSNSSDTCTWMNHMYGLDMSKPGAQEYLNSIFKLYANWGVDFVKVDDLSSPYHKAEIEGYRKAIELCGRAILLSTSPGETPLTEASHIASHANLWRLLGDLWDEWKSVDHAFDVLEHWNSYRSPGHWPDPDMLPLGKLSKYGPVGLERYCRLSHDEQYSLMTLWCISASPLMLGGSLPENDSFTTNLITNKNAIEVNQISSNNRTLKNGKTPIWIADSNIKELKYLAVFNRDSIESEITISLESLNIKECQPYDIWKSKTLDISNSCIKCVLKPHACAFYKLQMIKSL
jgi:alpha-galactosidase